MDMKRKLLLSVLLLSILVVVVEYFVLSDYVPSSQRQEKRNRKNQSHGRGHSPSRPHRTEQVVKFTQRIKTTQETSAQQINGPWSSQYEESQLLVIRARKSEKLKRRELRKRVENFLEERSGKSQIKANNQRTITMQAKTRAILEARDRKTSEYYFTHLFLRRHLGKDLMTQLSLLALGESPVR